MFGHQYHVTPLVHSLVVLIAWLRINRGAPTAMMLVRTHTRQLMTANLLAGIGLVLSAIMLPLVPRLEAVLFCLLLGDAISFAFFNQAALKGIQHSHSAVRQLGCSFAAAALASAGTFFLAPLNPGTRAAVICVPMLLIAAQVLLGFRHFLRGARIGLSLPGSQHS
jgi:hypothetical protein